MAGTTATFSVVFSGAPKLVGSALAIEVVLVPLAPPLAPPLALPAEEQPAASPATAVSAAAHAAVRHHIRLPVTGTPH
jgi:hypothetical protein